MSQNAADPKTRAASLLAYGWPVQRVAEEIGRNRRTVQRWQKDPKFTALVQEFRRSSLREVVSAMETTSRKAVAVLSRALDDENPHVRIRAALGIVNALPKLAAYADLETRIAALEAAQTELEDL